MELVKYVKLMSQTPRQPFIFNCRLLLFLNRFLFTGINVNPKGTELDVLVLHLAWSECSAALASISHNVIQREVYI